MIRYAIPTLGSISLKRLMTRILLLTLCVLAMLSTLSTAHAIGDSGGCGSWLRSPLGKAIESGVPEDVVREVENWVDYKEKSLSRLTKLKHWASGGTARQQWRQQQTLNLLEGIPEKGAVCSSGALLPAAVHAGNLEVARFLLGSPMGFDLKVPTDILFSCDDFGLSTYERLTRFRATLELILDSGKADIHALKDGRTVLQRCFEPELVSLYIQRGADTTVERSVSGQRRNLLDDAVESAATLEEGNRGGRHLAEERRLRVMKHQLPTEQ